MPNPSSVRSEQKLELVDPIWTRLREEASQVLKSDPAMAGVVFATVLNRARLEEAISYRLAQRLGHPDLNAGLLYDTFEELIDRNAELVDAFRADLMAVFDRDPACDRFIEPLLYFKGFHALQTYRFANLLWNDGRRDLALSLQSEASRNFAIDIHPTARIGRGIFIDHGHGIVIGATAVVGDNVSMLHAVTLGGTGKTGGDRHPKIEDGVLLGAGAKVLGNIRVGHCSRVAAGSVVLKDVPPCKTVAGVPAKIVGDADCAEPSLTMDQLFNSDN